MSHSYMSPKLLLQFYKDDKVPKLVTSRPQTHHQSNKRNHYHPFHHTQKKKSLTHSLLDQYFNKPSATREASNHKTNPRVNIQNSLEQSPPANHQLHYASPNDHRMQTMNSNFRNRSQSHSPQPSPSPPIPRKTFQQKKYQQQQSSIRLLTDQNNQLKALTSQLIQKLHSMQQIHNQLHQRIKQLEQLNQQLIKQNHHQKNYKNYEQKVKNKVYQDIGYYFHGVVGEFMEKMKKEKINPVIESQIQNFLQLVLNVNDVTVSNKQAINNHHKINTENVDTTINQIIQKGKQKRDYKSISKKRETSASPMSKYEAVFQKINNMHSGSRNIENQRNQRSHFMQNNNEDQENRMKYRVSPSPSASKRRVKIFNKSYATHGTQNNPQRQGGKVVKNLFSSTNNRDYL